MKYISYRESTIDEKTRKIHNQQYIKKQLIQQKEYFDNMFKNIDETIYLDEEQRKIVLTDENNVMIIAGAGSGKTTTITAKINYLIEKQKIKDNEIMLISFTNKAVEELIQRINKDFKHNITIQTFHKFGYEMIKNNTTPAPKILSDNYNIIKEYIEKKLINNKKKLKKFIDFYTYYFDITEEVLILNNLEKYNKYKNKQKYATLKQKIEYIKTKEQESQNKNKTIKNEYTQTTEETLIANYLYINNIEYEYKKTYEYINDYKPDFTILYQNKIYYIEQFNINEKNKFKYINNIKKIRKIHKKHNTKLIEIYEENIIEQLSKKLQENKIITQKKSVTEIFNKLIIEKQDTTYKNFIHFCKTYISLFKSKGYTQKDFNKLNTKTKRKKIFIDFIKELYKYYQYKLYRTNQIDYDDMINKANKIIEKQEKPKLKYKYIIIDEYQDISNSRFKLIKNISEKINSKIIVVGDDWQCIYSFAASNINLFTQFKKNVDYCEILRITKTYRNSQQLIDIAGKFIQQNKNQIKKELKSNKMQKEPIKILTYKKNEKQRKTIEAIEYLIKKYGPQKNILILGRYTFDKNKIIDNKIIIEKEGTIIYKKQPQIKINYMTIHSSKGLGYDNVILINASDEKLGFPSKIKTDPILEDLMTNDRTIRYSEERRLFYVALTRTKNEIIIITPKSNASKFVTEIKKYKNKK